MTAVNPIRACLITNPRSGRGGIDLSPILPVLAAHGWQCDVRQKLHGGHATELARKAVDEGYDVIVACGGDGTVGEVVEGVLGSDVAVGVLPGGTANLWAHEIGVSMNLREAALQLVGSVRRRADVGRVTINGEHGQYFLLMAGLGLDASVLSTLSKKWKGRLGMLAYLPAIGRALPKTKPFAAMLDLDGVARQTHAVQIVVGNTRRYASVTSVTPEARADDGKLDVCVLEPGNPLTGAHQISTLILRNRPSPWTAVNDRVGHFTVRATEVLPLQADGGRVKQKKVEVLDDGVVYEFTVRSQALTALVPREYSGDLFQNDTSAALSPQPTVTSDEKGRKNRYQVLTVGIDTISAKREKDGRVVTIQVGPETRAKNSQGEKESVSTFLASLHEGQAISVKGVKDKKRGVLMAEKLRG